MYECDAHRMSQCKEAASNRECGTKNCSAKGADTERQGGGMGFTGRQLLFIYCAGTKMNGVLVCKEKHFRINGGHCHCVPAEVSVSQAIGPFVPEQDYQ